MNSTVHVEGGGGRRDFPQMETENLQHICTEKASTPSSASDFFYFFFPPLDAARTCQREKKILCFLRQVCPDAGQYGLPGVPSKAVSCEAWFSVMQLSGSLCGCFFCFIFWR